MTGPQAAGLLYALADMAEAGSWVLFGACAVLFLVALLLLRLALTDDRW